ncbi:4-hydroxybenzoate synthetase [Mergibacter septicus]|uniref:4-hydroxybenzoate synthetase n=1 Tax=Mergibacter septicus TaxID=221402 RepID=A0A8E3S845_9PAST|nr:chorismate lyase [Mergibacter septicus]AWX14835.1 4-hydroxybenzoate synthetase [Mergibacter septicus]QDJ14087.1 4-hydroxybenzoate synthetase [Mergibacter septicus]UTU48464.1 chorismate lyase [Mergibacter septicus]WMR95907.1 chorismate lyase [Mergibacter septicus]
MLRKELELDYYRTWLQQDDWQREFSFLPQKIRVWLEEQNSLTAKLKLYFPELQVHLISEGWIKAEKINADGWLREVILKHRARKLVFAQTFIPEKTANSVAKPLLSIGAKPIGEWLFKQKLRREDLKWKQDPISGNYARKSRLKILGQPLEVSEMFFNLEDY